MATTLTRTQFITRVSARLFAAAVRGQKSVDRIQYEAVRDACDLADYLERLGMAEWQMVRPAAATVSPTRVHVDGTPAVSWDSGVTYSSFSSDTCGSLAYDSPSTGSNWTLEIAGTQQNTEADARLHNRLYALSVDAGVATFKLTAPDGRTVVGGPGRVARCEWSDRADFRYEIHGTAPLWRAVSH